MGAPVYKLGELVEKDGPPPADALTVDFKHDLHRGLKSRQIAMVTPVVMLTLMQCRSPSEELSVLDLSLALAVASLLGKKTNPKRLLFVPAPLVSSSATASSALSFIW